MICHAFVKHGWSGNLITLNVNVMRTRVKICGITKPEDAIHAARSGADAIGLVFYDASPRHVTVEQACQIVAVLPPFVTVVGLVVNAAESQIRHLIEQVPIGLLQFHGDESPQECELYGKPYLKAIRMKEGVDLIAIEKQFERAAGLLLDVFKSGEPGGTGECFDWAMIPPGLTKPVVLAGGLTPTNVAGAVKKVQPYGVDVSSGVESEKGIKDRSKVAGFIQAVREIDL